MLLGNGQVPADLVCPALRVDDANAEDVAVVLFIRDEMEPAADLVSRDRNRRALLAEATNGPEVVQAIGVAGIWIPTRVALLSPGSRTQVSPSDG